MRVFVLPAWYKDTRNPENCIFIYEQALALKRKGCEVIVLSVQPAPVTKKPESAISRCDNDGLITYYTSVPALAPSKLRELFVKEFRFALRKLTEYAAERHGKPDVFYAHFTFAAGYAALDIASEMSVPLVVEEHYSGLMEKVDPVLRRYVSRTVREANRFICVSEGLKNAVVKLAGTNNKITVIPNMINPCFTYHPVPDGERFVFFSMGYLIPRKGFDVLIRAFCEEFSEEDKVILRIAGSGEEKENLRGLIASFGASDKVLLIGQLNREETLREYADCHCFALASRAETYGLVYREAMAVGRPVISTKHGGFGEDWNDRFGCLTDIDDTVQLRAAMRHIYTHYTEYDGREISKECLKQCSEDGVAEKVCSVLSDAEKKENG